MNLSDKTVAIIGGGPGGLTLARLLQLKNISAKAYERDTNRNIRTQGATLDLHSDSGLKAIKKAELFDEFKTKYRPGAEKGRVVDFLGNIIYDEHENADEDTDFDSPAARPEIDRSELRDLLLDSLAENSVIWDRQFTELKKVGEKWEVSFKNGEKITVDLVIGADGSQSKIRKYLTEISGSYAGITIFQGNVDDAENAVPEVAKLLKGGKIYIFHDDKYIHISAKGDGSIDFYISSKMPENWAVANKNIFENREKLLNWYDENFKGWSEIWRKLFEKVDLPMLVRPQYAVPADQHWEAQSRITVLGDAGHIMAPSGEGVNLAMLDALELAENLTEKDFPTIREAIADYEKGMFARAKAELAESADMIAWMHSAGAQEKIVGLFSN